MSRRRFLALGLGGTIVAAGAGAAVLRARQSSTPADASLPRVRVVTPSPGTVAPPVTPTPAATVVTSPTSTPAPARPSLAEENALAGDASWLPVNGDVGSVAGFASPRSVIAGETVRFHLAASSGRATVRIFRVGWYGGAGARLVHTVENVACQPIAVRTDERRMVFASWDSSLELPIPSNWMTGVYVARVDSADGLQHMVPFWVRSPARKAPILVLSGLLTYAAYSAWGRYSLYASDSPDGRRAYAVSLDRPFNRNWGAGDLLTWEYQFLRWFEQSGFDADYATDLDLEEGPGLVEGRRLIILPGHHEYYTDAMRQSLEAAVAAGTNLAVFGSNALYWRVRMEDSDRGLRRNVVCYKDAALDPDTTNPTIRFRDPPISRPEAALLGVQYEQTNSNAPSWVVYDASHWAYEGTGLSTGESIPGLVGPEYDRVVTGVTPASVELLAQSPLVNDYGEQTYTHATLVTHPSGARVFATGTLNWNFALDPYRIPRWRGVGTVEPRLQKMAANVVRRLST